MSPSVIFVHWCSKSITLHRFRTDVSESSSDFDQAELHSMNHEASSLELALSTRQLIPSTILEQLQAEQDEIHACSFSDADRGKWTELWMQQGTPAPSVLVFMYFDSDGPEPKIVREIVLEQLRSISIVDIGLVLQYV